MGIVVVIVGVIVMGWSSRRLIHTMLSLIMPSEAGNFSELILSNVQPVRGPKVVVIGGGTGLSIMLRGLKTEDL